MVDGFDGQRLIVLTRKDHHRHVRSLLHDAAKGFGAVAVGKVRVEQYQRGCFRVQTRESVESRGTQFTWTLGLTFHQAQAYQVRVSGVVFNQQNARRFFFHYFYSSSRGRLAEPNQNSSMDCTTEK
jgi:hypothetical protein